MRCFRAWKTSLEQAAVARRYTQTAAQHHHKQCQRLHFQAWKTASQQSQFVARIHHLQTEHERRLVETASEYQVKIQQLQQELEESRRQVAVSQQYRQRLEDDLRQVFLRGVSAMNIEALTLFNSNHKTKQQDKDAGAETVNKQDRSDTHGYEVAHSELRGERADALLREKTRSAPEPLVDSASDRDLAEILTQQPTGREELDSKLQTMLASSTSRLETSLRSTRDAPEKKPHHAHGTNTSAPMGTGRRWPNSAPSTNLLRSAEMVQRHMMGAASTAVVTDPLSSSLTFQAPPHTVRLMPKSTQSTKYQVEMAYLRNTVAGGEPTTSKSARASAVAPARSPPRYRFG
ncbi:hypothetical protein PybrP1_005190 [[Pythium] brassicae (nom. inval.)]|nr:hypothetical protein PybrP1_005190 [[Pythium] brassicae (nom. inval.)]